MLPLLCACGSPALSSKEPITPLADGYLPNDTGVPAEETPDTGSRDTSVERENAVAPAIVLNEVVTRNASTADDGSGDWPDWFELYNASAESVPLSDLMVRDEADQVWIGDRGDLAPGAWHLVWADGLGVDGSAPFALDGDGDQLTLLVRGVVADRLATGKLDTDLAWARFPDGGEWALTARTSPEATNGTDPGDSFDRSELVFQNDTFTDINILLDAGDISSLRASRLSWVEGGVEMPEGTYDRVGVRLKAYVGSSRTIDQKCGWKIDLNRYEDHQWRGLKALTLNNMVQDYTYVHEFMAYALYRAAGVPAPRTGYARVSVNGEYYGLYLVVENIDDEFLDRWFDSNEGPLYEGAYGVDLYDGYIASFDYDQGPEEDDRSGLQRMADIMDAGASEANLAELETVMDMGELRSNMAVEGLALHWDGYQTANNYRLYEDPTDGLWRIIPWGADQTFINYYYGPWDGRGRLFTYCLSVDSCSDAYDEELLRVADVMDELDLVTQATDLEGWLYAEIEDDARREFGMSTHDYYFDYTMAVTAAWPQTVRDAVAAR
jgi:hypothetical protein